MSELPLDDNYKPAVGGYDPAGHRVVALEAVSVTTDTTNNVVYGILQSNASFSASSLSINDPTTTTQKAGVNAAGSLQVAGQGTAGTAAGGVVTIQGVAGGTAVPISGTISATNPSVGTDGSAIPTSSTLIGASDGTNLQQLLVESSSNRNLRTGIYSGANEATVTGANALKVDNSAVTQPVSGTVTANAGSGNFTVAQATGSNLHTVIDAGSAVIGSTAIQATSGTALAADVSNTELRVSNYVKTSAAGDTALTLGQATMANSLPVAIASNQSSIPATQSGTWTVQPGNTQNTTPWLESIHDGTNKANVLAAASVSNALSAQGAVLTAGADQEVSFTTTTAQNVASTDVTNYRWVSLQINVQGTSSVVAFQGSDDNTNWFSILLLSSTAANNGPNSSVTTTGIWHGPLPCRYFRLNVAGISAGTTSGIVEFQTMPSAMHSMGVTAVQGGTWVFNAQSATTGGSSDYHLISAATTNANNIKNSAGQVYGYELGNNGASDAWVKLYNSASAPTAGSGTPYRTIYVPKGARASYHSSTGLLMGAGIGLTITGGAADADTTAVGAAQVTVEIDYK